MTTTTDAPDHSLTIEEAKADEFARLVRNDVRDSEGFVGSDELGKDAIFLDIAQKYIEEDGGFLEADEEDAGPDAATAGEIIPAPYSGKVSNSNVLILGYMPVDAFGQITLFTARYQDDPDQTTLSQNEFKSRIERAWRFFMACWNKPESFASDKRVADLARHIDDRAKAHELKSVRIVFVTNLRLTTRDYDRESNVGLDVKYDVYDIDRLYRASNQSIGFEDIDVDFTAMKCGPLPCLEATGKDYLYKSYLLMLDGATLAAIFHRYGSRLYDTNLRSYLESKTKVNKRMLATIRSTPQKFLAYNNGLTAIASRIDAETRGLQTCITRIVGLQIVNGAQTTSSIYKASTDKKSAEDLERVHVVMKLTKTEPEDIETFVPEITEYANTQNPIKGSDLQANRTIHRKMETLAREIYCPGDINRQWFYERTRGSYQAALAREGTTKKRKQEFQERIPASNRFDKTDLAVYYMAWMGRPDSVSRGPQKNFADFTKLITEGDASLSEDPIDAKFFKLTVAKAIIYAAARKAVAKCQIPKIPSSVTAYVVAYFADRFGDRIRLNEIWEKQSVSEGLRALFERWAPEVNGVIHASNIGDKLLTEWCKKDGCWTAIRNHDFSADGIDVPEIGTKDTGAQTAASSKPASVASTPITVPVASTPSQPRPTNGSGKGGAHAPLDADDVQITMKVSPTEWGRIAEWVAAEPGYTIVDSRFAYSMAQYASSGWPMEPSLKQARWAARLARSALRASVISISIA